MYIFELYLMINYTNALNIIINKGFLLIENDHNFILIQISL